MTITEPKLTKPSASIVEPKPAKSSAEPKPKPTPSVPASDPLLAKQGTSCAAWADLWIGWRKGQCHAYEDRFVAQSSLEAEGVDGVVAVIDGHGGARAAEFLQKNLTPTLVHQVRKGGESTGWIQQTFEGLENQFIKEAKSAKDDSGACLTMVMFRNRSVHVGWCGDCRAIIVRDSGKTHALTRDHRAGLKSEDQRIKDAGAFVKDGRVLGVLMPSRSVGDFDLKQKCPGAVIAVPDIKNYELQKGDTHLVVASDGLWDNIHAERVGRLLGRSQKSAQKLGQELLKECRGEVDDVTLIIVGLHEGIS